MKDDMQSLQAFVQELNSITPFKVGDVVVWKGEEFQNKLKPDLNQKAIVSYAYPDTIFRANDECSGGHYEFEPIDIRLTFIGSEGDIIEYPYDSRRFRLAY